MNKEDRKDLVTEKMVTAAEAAYWDCANDPEGSRDMRAALSAALAVQEPAEPDYGYMRVVEVFDRNETAGAFLSEDGEGGFAAGVARMAAEITRLRRELEEARKALEKHGVSSDD